MIVLACDIRGPLFLTRLNAHLSQVRTSVSVVEKSHSGLAAAPPGRWWQRPNRVGEKIAVSPFFSESLVFFLLHFLEA